MDDVLARLCAVYEVENLNQLADKLGGPYSASELYRWEKNAKDGKQGPVFSTAVELLELAGMLTQSTDGDGSTARSLREIQVAAEALAQDVVRLRSALDGLR